MQFLIDIFQRLECFIKVPHKCEFEFGISWRLIILFLYTFRQISEKYFETIPYNLTVSISYKNKNLNSVNDYYE